MEGVGRPEAGSSSASAPDPRQEGAAALSPVTADAETQVRPNEEQADGDDEDEEIEPHAGLHGFVPGPLIPLKEQLELDKEDESLRRWKEKLLGCIDGEVNGQMEPEVIFHSMGIVSEGCAEAVNSLPILEHRNRVLFTLKEGSQYRLKLTFSVKHNILSGLTYVNTVWKKGIQVDQSKGMLGTFAPQREPYEHLLEEETTPTGALAHGVYSARLKFEDDDKRCHMVLDYTFEIKRCC